MHIYSKKKWRYYYGTALKDLNGEFKSMCPTPSICTPYFISYLDHSFPAIPCAQFPYPEQKLPEQNTLIKLSQANLKYWSNGGVTLDRKFEV